MRVFLRALKIGGLIQFMRMLLAMRHGEPYFDDQMFYVDYARKRALETFGLPPDWSYSEADLRNRARRALSIRSMRSLTGAWQELIFLVTYEFDRDSLIEIERAHIAQKNRPKQIWEREH